MQQPFVEDLPPPVSALVGMKEDFVLLPVYCVSAGFLSRKCRRQTCHSSAASRHVSATWKQHHSTSSCGQLVLTCDQKRV